MDKKEQFLLPASVIAAGLLISGAVLWNGSQPGQLAAVGDAPPTIAVDIAKVDITGDPYIGNADAPITIAFWSDFQCPYCQQFELTTLPQIVQAYVATGKAKVVFMDFAFLGPDSMDAAVYNRAVWKLYPSQYFAWREAMYEAQDEEHGGFGDAASIDTLNATVAGLDAARIKSDVEANRAAYLAAAEADKAEAQEQGINATPSFVIGKEMIAGAYPFAKFQAALDALQ